MCLINQAYRKRSHDCILYNRILATKGSENVFSCINDARTWIEIWSKEKERRNAQDEIYRTKSDVTQGIEKGEDTIKDDCFEPINASLLELLRDAMQGKWAFLGPRPTQYCETYRPHPISRTYTRWRIIRFVTERKFSYDPTRKSDRYGRPDVGYIIKVIFSYPGCLLVREVMS
jgi:hypothetical protein